MPSLLSRDAILAAPDIKTEDVDVPEWGGTVRVRGLTAAQRDVFEAESLSGNGKSRDVNFANLRSRLIALAIVGEDDKPLFKPGDVKALGEKAAGPIDRLFDVASRLSGMGQADVEALSGNSNGQSDGSPSD